MPKQPSILFVTTINLSANPRCLKEMRAAVESGYNVSVIKFSYNNWTNEYEKAIEDELTGVNWIVLSALRSPLIPWVLASFISTVSKLMLKINPKNIKLIAYALDKRSYLLNRKLGTLRNQYDIVVAHNPGAFWPVYNFSTTHNIPYGIDIEDYHPGEYNDESYSSKMKLMMHKVLSHAAYITAASPLILKHSIKDVDASKDCNVINNVFSLKQKPVYKNLPLEGKLRLFWFSQHVGLDRGVQDIIMTMNKIDNYSVELTIMGNCSDEVRTALEQLSKVNRHSIVFKSPLSEKELIEESSNHHIGLALENGANINRNVCLTNKVFTYLLAGNAIIASDTEAQKAFMQANPGIGYVYSRGNVNELKSVLDDIYNNRVNLEGMRKVSYNLALEKYNWKNEKNIFLSLIDRHLKRA